MISKISSQYTDSNLVALRGEERLIRQEALFDELVKIAEESANYGIGHSLKVMGTAAAGGAIGLGAAELLGRKLKFFNPSTALTPKSHSNRVLAARIILPILTSTAAMLADKYRQRLKEEYSKTKGYKAEE